MVLSGIGSVQALISTFLWRSIFKAYAGRKVASAMFMLMGRIQAIPQGDVQ